MKLPPLPFEAKPVPRIHKPSAAEVWARIYDEPVVLTGCMENWELFQGLRARKTTQEKLSFLSGLVGEDDRLNYLTLPRQSGGEFHFQDESLTESGEPPFRQASFPEFAERIASSMNGSGDYVFMPAHEIKQGSGLQHALPSNLFPFLREEDIRPRLWMGAGGHITNLHYDEFGTLISMVEGVKRVTMLPPEVLPYVYHMPFDRLIGMAQVNAVRLLNPDLERFPLFKTALQNAHVVELQPGEVLLVPPMWWHHVQSFGLNVMINNRILLASLEQLIAMQKNLTQAIRLFYKRPQAERAAARKLFQWELFAQPRTEAPGAATLDAPAAELLEETKRILSPMHSAWRKWHGMLYDRFVFQAQGEPYPMMPPGELERMVERRAGTSCFFPMVDVVEAELREMELERQAQAKP